MIFLIKLALSVLNIFDMFFCIFGDIVQNILIKKLIKCLQYSFKFNIIPNWFALLSLRIAIPWKLFQIL